MLGSYSGNYSRLPRDEKDETSLYAPLSDGARREQGCYTELARTIYTLFLHFLVLLLAGILLVRRVSPDSTCNPLLPSELPFASDVASHVATTFVPGGFVEGPPPPNPYLGAPTAERDALWEGLYDVGMVVMSAEEAAQMPVSTTPVVDERAEADESRYLVTLEVFHQLHCLDYLRHASYGLGNHHAGEPEWSKTRHVDHCVDYLRQVIQCHGDLTPITLDRVSGVPALPLPNPAPYRPDFAIQHSCRDFERVYEFALARNSSGYKVA